jgi:hypothetical protein
MFLKWKYKPSSPSHSLEFSPLNSDPFPGMTLIKNAFLEYFDRPIDYKQSLLLRGKYDLAPLVCDCHLDSLYHPAHLVMANVFDRTVGREVGVHLELGH